jgi:phosphate transport system substrate-binding protein
LDGSDARALATGTLIGGAYRVVRPVAEGGMGAIYEVEQIATGARRALKVMHGHFALDPAFRARFAREARVTASIPSDHVALVLDAGQDAATGALFIVMELLNGTTLSHELRRGGPFPAAAARTVLGQIAHALGAAHALGIVHRDLKPANVFLSRSRHASLPFTVKLLDFGIAKAVAGDSEATAAVLGTPVWMAPEQTSLSEGIGPRADVWSFGLLTFLILTGRHYFASGNAKSVATTTALREVVLEPLVAASVRAGELGKSDCLPAGFDAWFARCVDREPSNRFADARVAFDALAPLLSAPASDGESLRWEAWQRDESESSEVLPLTAVETQPPSLALPRPPLPPSLAMSRSPGPRASWSVLALVAAVVLLVSAVVLSVTWRAHESRPASVASSTSPPTAAALPIAFRMHGSNTIGSELAPALAEAFLTKQTGASVVIRRRTAPDEMVVEARDGDRVIEAIEIYAHGSSTAFDDLGAARCDIGMSSRRIRRQEAEKLASLGDLSSAASEHVIALDGLAVIVNPTNSVSALSRSAIADIFTGKTRNWSEVGGADRPIVVHARDDKSGTYDTFKTLVLEGRELTSTAMRHESSEELSDAVADDARAVGFIGLRYIRSAKAVMVQEAGSLPLLPSPMTVSTEDYPLARRLYLYVPLGASVASHDFVDFAQSDAGQSIVQRGGFVDLRPVCDANAFRCTDCSQDYRETVHSACRMSMDFRFDRGSTDLDTRALSDLQRMVAVMQRPEYASRSLLLLGFSDATGGDSANLTLSRQRADTVAGQLRARGLHVEAIRGFGPRMPVADDSNDEGRERNRRVEVWLR